MNESNLLHYKDTFFYLNNITSYMKVRHKIVLNDDYYKILKEDLFNLLHSIGFAIRLLEYQDL